MVIREEKEEELTLFSELRKRDKTTTTNNNTASLSGINNNNNTNNNNNQVGSSPLSMIISFVPPHRKTAAERFLDSENDKSDYDWLITPPGTPLVTSSGSGLNKLGMNQMGMLNGNARPTALNSRLMNVQEKPALRTNVVSKGTNFSLGLSSLTTTSNRRSRPATPTGRPTLPASTTKTSRPSTPTSKVSLSSNKSSAPPTRSSTPTRTTPRCSTPTGRSSLPNSRTSLPASRSTSRPSTPTRRNSAPSSVTSGAGPRGRSSSLTRSAGVESRNPVPSRGSSPTVKFKAWKPEEMGFSFDAPPNLRTTLPERPASASRGRPSPRVANSRSSSVEAVPNGRRRQQSCSPVKLRSSNSSAFGSRSSGPIKSRVQTNVNDDVNPVVVGSKMVKRVVNMRKLAPPDHLSVQNNFSAKLSSLDSVGFGGTLSKKSLDMALRHMDIRRNVPGNLRPVITKIPASSMYSVRSGGSSKSKTTSVSDSPLATRSNTSSEPSVNNTFFIDGIEIDGSEFGSEKGSSSPISHHGR